jgi:predicted DCC family thiol-disulfide oxidoreductase YuxK
MADMTSNPPAASQVEAAEIRDSLTLYYDGECPLCRAEIHFLAARNDAGLLRFIDINDKAFAAAGHPVSCAEAMAQMRGRLENGQVLTGIAVFAAAYRRARLPVLAWLFARPWLQPLLGFGYHWFARFRQPISRLIGPPLLWLARRRYPSKH